MPAPRLRRSARAVLAVAAIATLATTAVTSPAGADAVSDKKAQAQAIAQRIYDLNIQIEELAEAANGAQVELEGLNAQAVAAQAELDKSKTEEAKHRAELRAYAINAYVHGDLPTRLDPVGDPSVDIDPRYGYLQAASDNRQQLVDQLLQSEAKVKTQLAQLKDAQEAAAAKAKDLQERQAAAQAAVDEQQRIKGRVDAELSTLVLQAEAERAAAERAAAERDALAQDATAAGSAPSGTSPSTGPEDVPPTTVFIPRRPVPPGPPPPPFAEGAVKAIEYARAQLGKPYVWGAEGPNSFDCSGLTMQAWRAGGVRMDHWTGSQYAQTRPILLTDVQPGDLIFYNGQQHVALYIGDGKIIHAPHSGAVVAIEDMYYWHTDMAATRPLP